METTQFRFSIVTAMEWNESKALQFLLLNSYLLLKLADIFTNPDLPMKSNLQSIINYSHSRSTTDLSAIFIAINASDKSVEEFFKEIQEGKLTRDNAARLVDIICDLKSS
jgi:hypothetical protein